MGSYGRSIRVCRARSSSRSLFSALRLQEEDVFLCAPEMPKLGRERRGSKGKGHRERWVKAFQLQEAPAASGRGPAPFSSAAFLTLRALCYLPRLPCQDFLPHPLPKPVVSVLPPTPCFLSSTFLLSGEMCPCLSACFPPPAIAVIDRQGAPSPQVAVIWVLAL